MGELRVLVDTRNESWIPNLFVRQTEAMVARDGDALLRFCHELEAARRPSYAAQAAAAGAQLLGPTRERPQPADGDMMQPPQKRHSHAGPVGSAHNLK